MNPHSIELCCGAARAEVALRGAELRRWSVGPTPLLWEKDPAYWDETAPILFPLVGWTRGGARVAGKTFPLGLHGFARAMNFAGETLTPARARFTLISGAESLALYPFPFRLCVDYCLSERDLTTSLTVKNRGVGPMPYACGLHPGFRWPFAGGAWNDYSIWFSAPEDPFAPEISAQGLFLKSRRRVPLQGQKLALTPELFAAEALCFLNARSHGLRFQHAGGAALAIETSDFPHFALWSKPQANFLSIECWTGHGDPEDFHGDLFDAGRRRASWRALFLCSRADALKGLPLPERGCLNFRVPVEGGDSWRENPKPCRRRRERRISPAFAPAPSQASAGPPSASS